MNDRSFDALTRRASLVTLGAAGLATLAGSLTGYAKNNRTNTNRKAKKKCKRQAGQCTSVVTEACEGDPDCLERLLACCEPTGRCAIVGFLDCLIS
jgi:hypothetical protein